MMLKGRAFEAMQSHVTGKAVFGERDIYTRLLGSSAEPVIDPEYVRQQRTRSESMGLSVDKSRLRRSVEWFIKAIPGCIAGRSVLDVGTRDGALLDILKSRRVRHCEGIELLPEVADNGRQKGRLVRTADMRRLPDPSNAWDAVTCIHALEHAPDPSTALAEMSRVVRPGGWILLVVPRETEPSADSAHNTAFCDSAAVKSLIASEKTLDVDTIRCRADRPSAKSPEICIAVKKR